MSNQASGPQYDEEALAWLRKLITSANPPRAIADGYQQIREELLVYLGSAVPFRDLAPPRTVPAVEHPPCPVCTRAMVVRRNRAQGTFFLGCTGYPSCRGTRNLPQSGAYAPIAPARPQPNTNAAPMPDGHRQIDLT